MERNLCATFQGQTAFDLVDNDMLRLLEDLKKKQNKEEVNKRKAKKRAETQDRTIEPDSQSQVKKVKVEITGGPEENTKSNEIGEFMTINLRYFLGDCALGNLFYKFIKYLFFELFKAKYLLNILQT